MSRLTEKEIDLIRETRAATRPGAQGVTEIEQEAHRLRSVAFGEQLGRGLSAVAYWTGLAGLGSLVYDLVICPIANAMQRRRAIHQLRRLDDRMLDDIGLDRGTLESFGETLSPSHLPDGRVIEGPVARCRNWLLKCQTIRELEALSERQLTDIGIERADIKATVERAIKQDRAGSAKAAAQRHALQASKPVQRRRADPMVGGRKREAPGALPLLLGPWIAPQHRGDIA